MKNLTIRLRITWLTIIAMLMFGAIVLLAPPFSQTNAHFARSAADLAATMDFPHRSDLFNGFRGNLLADMVFLLAYGFLLRASAQWHQRQPAARVAAALTLVLMLCDAVE